MQKYTFNKYISPTLASQMCGVHKHTILRWIAEGIMPAEEVKFKSGKKRYYISILEIPAYLRK